MDHIAYGVRPSQRRKELSKGLIEEMCIGTWKTESKFTMYNGIETIILYQGGTGKGIQAKKQKN